MPITKSAKKALRQSRKRQISNAKIKNQLQSTLRQLKKHPSTKLLSQTYSNLDKAVKKHLIHPNKAARLKSQLSRKTA